MTVDELMTDEVLGKQHVVWEYRDNRSLPEVAREKISRYFSECSDYNTPAVFVKYQVSPEGLGFWDRLRGRSPIFENWIFQGEDGEIKVLSCGSRKKGRVPTNLDDYLTNAYCVSLTFTFGSHYNGNCVVEWNAGSSKVGKTSG